MGHLTISYESLRISINFEPITHIMAICGFGICWMLYVLAFISIVMQRLKTSNASVIKKPDVLLLVQTVILIAYKTFTTCLWNFYVAPTKFMHAVIMIITFLEPGYHPFMYLIFNR